MSVRSAELIALSDLRHDTGDILGQANQRHDVADIDAGGGRHRNLLATPHQRPQENSARRVAQPGGDFAQRSAVQFARGDENLDHPAGNRSHDVLALDLLSDRRLRGHNRRARSDQQDFIACTQRRIDMRIDVLAVAQHAFDHGAQPDLLLELLHRAAGGDGNQIGARLKLPVRQIAGLAFGATRERSLELRGFLLEIDPHQLRRYERHEEHHNDVAEDVGHRICRGDIRLLLFQHLSRQSERLQRARRGSHHGGLRQAAGGNSGGRARVEMQDMGERQNHDQAGPADDQCEDDLVERLKAERSEELRTGPVSDREYKEPEQHRLEQRRDHECPELTQYDGGNQRAGGRSDGEPPDANPAKQRADRDRQQEEYFGAARDSMLHPVHRGLRLWLAHLRRAPGDIAVYFFGAAFEASYASR
jgi:hypothetical protein